MKILFVCLGNICRSPTAEVVMRVKLAQKGIDWVEVDSAGTAAYHIGNPPDPRTIKAGARRGYELSKLKARQLCEQDFYEFDYILALDLDNLTNIKEKAPSDSSASIQLAMSFSSDNLNAVPDPYYGEIDGFNDVIDLCENLSDGFIEFLLKNSSDD